MTKLQKVTVLGGLTAGVVTPATALAALNDQVNINSTTYPGLANIKPGQYVTTAINLFLGAAGVVAFVFLLWGGLQWILAGGDKEGTEKARKRITSALIGLAIVFSAYALLFIIRALFNVDVIGFNLQPIGT